MSCEIFLGIPCILVDFDVLFSSILQKSQEFVGNLWILRKILGNYKILMPSCNIFLGLGSAFWDSD